MIRAQGNSADGRLPGYLAFRDDLDAVRHGVAHQVYQRVADLLNDAVVQFRIAARQVHFDLFAGGFGRIAHRAGQPRIQRADRHHSRGRDLVLQAMRQLCEFVDVTLDAPHKAFELHQDFFHIGRYLRHRPRQYVEIVVAVHFEFAEIGPQGLFPGRRARQYF